MRPHRPRHPAERDQASQSGQEAPEVQALARQHDVVRASLTAIGRGEHDRVTKPLQHFPADSCLSRIKILAWDWNEHGRHDPSPPSAGRSGDQIPRGIDGALFLQLAAPTIPARQGTRRRLLRSRRLCAPEPLGPHLNAKGRAFNQRNKGLRARNCRSRRDAVSRAAYLRRAHVRDRR